MAQEVPPADDPVQDASAGVGEIVVTAQRRDQRLQDVPIAITVIGGEEALSRGVRNVDDIQIATPALNVTRVNQTPLFYLRGVGTQSQLTGEEPSIPLYIDGFYVSSSAGSNFALNNIERIEVLRGPQGTLFGRNGTGGLINIITRTPSHNPRGSVSIGYGNYNTVDASLYATTGIAPEVAADIAAYFSRRYDGFGTNLFTGNDVGINRDFAVRTKWLLTPWEATRITLSADYSNSRSDLGANKQLAPGTLGFDGVTRRAGPQDVNANIDPFYRTRIWSVTGRWDQDLGFGTLVNMTQYRRSRTFYTLDSDSIPVDFNTAAQDEYTRIFTNELQLQSPSSSDIQWVIGGFYLKSNAGVDPTRVGGSQFVPLGIAFQERFGNIRTQSFAGFAQATVNIFPQTQLTLGGRITRDEKTLSGQVINTLANGSQVIAVAGPTTPELNSSRFTYRIALDHRLSDDVLLYGIVSRGYKAGSFNVLAVADPPVRPETLDAVEMGLKSDLFNRRLRVNIAAYHYDYRNIQLSQLAPATAGGSGGIKILNATSSEIWGLELETVARVTNELTLSGSVAYTHGRYGDFTGAPANYPRPWDCATGTPTGPTVGRNAICTGDASGNEVVRTTPWTFTAAASYETDISYGSIAMNASVYYNDGFFFEVDNRFRQPSYTLVNADMRWMSPNERYGVRLWARNLLDTEYYIGISTSSNDLTAPGAPRTYGVSLLANF